MSNKIFTILFIAFISAFFFMNIFSEDSAFSEQENRVLTQKPTLTWKDFKSGKYTEEVEEYISDQFPFKNQLVGFKGKIDRTMGKKENNDVLFGKEGYLLERFDQVGDRLEKNIKTINTFVNENSLSKLSVLLAPTAIGVYPEYMPDYISSVSQGETLKEIEKLFLDKINFIDVHANLTEARDEAIYFKTDHHWTMRGAYMAYQVAAESLNFTPLRIEEFDVNSVSQSFLGTLYSKATAYDYEPDEIELFIPKRGPEVEVTYEGKTVSDTMYELSYLEVKDKYSLFLDGNHSLVKIKTDADTDRKLIVIKDSYAHAFIPFLANHFSEIHVLDLRYFKEAVTPYMAEHNLDDVLILYNLPNFTNDTSLGLFR